MFVHRKSLRKLVQKRLVPFLSLSRQSGIIAYLRPFNKTFHGHVSEINNFNLNLNLIHGCAGQLVFPSQSGKSLFLFFNTLPLTTIMETAHHRKPVLMTSLASYLSRIATRPILKK